MSTIDSHTSPAAPAPRPPRELRASTGYLLKRLGWAIKERTYEALEPTGLTPAHHAVLALLDEEPRETQAMIADALGLDRSHLVGLLDELEERVLIERRRDPDDRRRHIVTLTGEGRKMLGRMRPISAQVEEDFLAPLDPGQRAQLHALLLHLAAGHDARYANGDAP